MKRTQERSRSDWSKGAAVTIMTETTESVSQGSSEQGGESIPEEMTQNVKGHHHIAARRASLLLLPEKSSPPPSNTTAFTSLFSSELSFLLLIKSQVFTRVNPFTLTLIHIHVRPILSSPCSREFATTSAQDEETTTAVGAHGN